MKNNEIGTSKQPHCEQIGPPLSEELLDVIAAAVGRIETAVTKTADRVDAIASAVTVLKTDPRRPFVN